MPFRKEFSGFTPSPAQEGYCEPICEDDRKAGPSTILARIALTRDSSGRTGTSGAEIDQN
jgi:hypothetical protein